MTAFPPKAVFYIPYLFFIINHTFKEWQCNRSAPLYCSLAVGEITWHSNSSKESVPSIQSASMLDSEFCDLHGTWNASKLFFFIMHDTHESMTTKRSQWQWLLIQMIIYATRNYVSKKTFLWSLKISSLCGLLSTEYSPVMKCSKQTQTNEQAFLPDSR